MSTISIIAAIADNNAIGKNQQLLWHLPADMKHFKELTMGHAIIMGRKTFESIGRPLPKRCNIVISRSDSVADRVIVAHSLEEAFGLAAGRQDTPALSETSDRCFVIGGGEIYRQAMELADRLYITEVHLVVDDADTFFPEISPEIWEEESRSERMTDEASGVEFEFVAYRRKEQL